MRHAGRRHDHLRLARRYSAVQESALKAHETQLEALVAMCIAEVSELIGHLEATREEEKRAIACELHEDLGSSLTALNMQQGGRPESRMRAAH